MTTREHELGRTLRTLLQEEAEAMQIDTVTDSRRLRRELTHADGVRRRVALGVVAAALAVVAGVVLWAGIGDPRSVAPADDGPAPEVSTAAPFFVHVTSGKQTPMAESLWRTIGFPRSTPTSWSSSPRPMGRPSPTPLSVTWDESWTSTPALSVG